MIVAVRRCGSSIAKERGMQPAPERKRVFERFYRMDKARVSSSDGGAGLGLSIARWAVVSNGGSIEFRDREGPGACCRISLPIERVRVTRPTS